MTKARFFIFGPPWTAFFAALLAPAVLQAQTPATAPAGAAPAHVRFWKTDLRAFPGLRLTFKPAAGKRAAHDLGSGGPGYVFNNYADEPAGRGTLEVLAAAAARPLVSLPADFASGAFLTLLVREPDQTGGAPQIEIIDDGHVAADATRSQITVRNFLTNLKEMRLAVGDNLNVQFVSSDCFLQMRGLKPALYPIRTNGTDLDGKPFEWNIDADFQQCRHQTLLVYPDPYGRVRPRLIVDGELQATPPPDSGDGQR